MATKSTKRSARKKAQKPRMEVRDLKPMKDAKAGYKEQDVPTIRNRKTARGSTRVEADKRSKRRLFREN